MPPLDLVASIFGLAAARLALAAAIVLSVFGLFSVDRARAAAILILSLAAIPTGVFAFMFLAQADPTERSIDHELTWAFVTFAVYFVLFVLIARGITGNPTLRWAYRFPLVTGLVGVVLLVVGVAARSWT